MQERGIQAIGHEHIRTNAYGNLIVAFPMETQAVRFRACDFGPIDLHGRGARGECPVTHQIESCKQLECRLIADKHCRSDLGDLQGGFDSGHLDAVLVWQIRPSAERERPDVYGERDAACWRYDDETPWICADGGCQLAIISGLPNGISNYGYELA